MHRLQIGLGGLAGVIALVGVADAIMNRADLTEAAAVPDAVSTVEPEETPVPQNDPLADAGVVPASPTPAEEVADVPPAGAGAIPLE